MIKRGFHSLTFLWGPFASAACLRYIFSHKCFSSSALLLCVANEAYWMYRFPRWRCLIDSDVLQALASPTSSILWLDGTWHRACKIAFTGSRVGPPSHYTHPWRSVGMVLTAIALLGHIPHSPRQLTRKLKKAHLKLHTLGLSVISGSKSAIVVWD